ncbi:MAG: hypothetical protein QXV37_02960, partial [Candidatus Jordarchaeaceae archaeon]
SSIILDEGSTINGPVVLEPNCHIGSGSNVGPFVSATSGCEIACRVTVQNSLIFGNAVVKDDSHLSNVIVYKNLLLHCV